MPPQVSVIVPVYNGERYLEACISSVLGQSMAEFELLILDDCSSDASVQVIQSFVDSRIQTSYQKENVGLFANLNHGIRKARAPLVYFLGQDDLLEAGCLESQVEFFSVHPDAGMAFCKHITIDSGGMELERGILGDLPELIESRLALQLFCYLGCLPGNISTVCVRRTCFREVGLFKEGFRVAGDYEMWLRICQRWPLGVLHKHLVRLRCHDNQLSRAPGSETAYILESRMIQATLRGMLPHEIQAYAKFYFMLRQNVHHSHLAIRRALEGRLREVAEIVSVMGPRDLGVGVLFWLVTANNHLFQPCPRYV